MNTDGSLCTNPGDYFIRTTNAAGGGLDGMDTTFLGLEGSTLWRAEDLDGPGCMALPDVIDWTGITLAVGVTELRFSGYFAARNLSTFDTGLAGDHIRILHQINGGGFVDGLWFSGRLTSPFLMASDPNLDGNGDDGIALGETLSFFDYIVGGPFPAGTTVDLKVTVSVNGGGEEVAFDWFRLSEGVAPVDLESFRVD